MASITKRPDGRYRVRWRDPDGKERAKHFRRKTDADTFAANVEADVSRGVYVDPALGRVTVAQFAEEWRGTQLHRDSTVERVDSALRLHVLPILGGIRMNAVKPSHIRAWVQDRSAVLAPSTLRVVYSYLVSMFSAAVQDRVIGVSPCTAEIRLPEVDDGELFIARPDQVHALADALPPRYRAVVYVAAGCGWRGGEVFGLMPEDVNFLGREIRVERQLKVVTGRKPYLSPPKTKRSKRVNELPDVTREALARHMKEYPPVEVEVDDETDPRKPVRRKATLMFTNINGDPIHRASWSHVWRPAVRKAGLPDGFGLHGLRDYFATLLIHNGASVKTVQLALGHSTPVITLNSYVGEWPEAIDRTRSLVDAALKQTAPEPDKIISGAD